ncbi:TPA: hypothetical protein ACH3X2_007100 [Trebouxia sp. C0005]
MGFRSNFAEDSDVSCATQNTSEQQRLRLEEEARQLEQELIEVEIQEKKDRIARARARLAQSRSDEAAVTTPAPVPARTPSDMDPGLAQTIMELRQQQAEAARQQEELRRQQDDFCQQQEQARREQEQARRQQELERQQQLEEQERRRHEEEHQRKETVAKLTAEVQRLQALAAAPSVVAPTASVPASEDMRRIARQTAALEEANRRTEQSLMRPSSHHITSTCADSAHDAELRSITRQTESMRRDAAAQEHSLASTMSHQKSLSSRRPSEAAVTARYNRSQQLMDQATKGMDILIMMDCTGSMAWAIASCKRQIKAVLEKVQSDYPEAVIRVAFIGYKDHGDSNERILLHKFVDKQDISSVEQFVGKIRANGGADGPEDIAGALQTALDLLKDRVQGFRAQTRMIIHFADAPCHGSQYHSMHDDYPGGDPHGLNPEKMLHELASKNVDYYFLEVQSRDTTKMTDIFKGCYPSGGNASCGFHVLPTGASPDSFMPAMLRSITMSASRAISYFSQTSSRRPSLTGHECDCEGEDAAYYDS